MTEPETAHGDTERKMPDQTADQQRIADTIWASLQQATLYTEEAREYEKALLDLALVLPYPLDEIRPRFKKMVQTSLYDWRTCKALLLRGDVELPPL